MQNPTKKAAPSGYFGKQFNRYATPEERAQYEHVTVPPAPAGIAGSP
jgi:hypothetical protein